MIDQAKQSHLEGSGSATASVNTLHMLLDARANFGRLLAMPDYGGQAFPSLIGNVILLLIRASNRNPDILTASILLCQDGEYAIRHAINVALIANHLLRTLGRDASHRAPVIGAALTMNLGMHALQEQLNKQAGPLTPEQRKAMQLHPISSREILRKLGISDSLWLDCVSQHHEMHDGSGYPAKLKGDDIQFESRLIGMADRYCAMLNRAAWRNEQLADSALYTSLGGPTASPDSRLGRLFIETLGIYPAGAMVQLINGEIGIVKQQGGSESTPIVVSLFNAILNPLDPPIERNTQSDDYSIVSILNHRKLTENISMEAIWGEEARS